MVKWGISENHIWLKIKMRDRPGQTIPLEKEKEEYIWLMQKKEIGEGKGEKKLRRKIFCQWRRRRMENGKEENIWRRKK